MAKREPKPSHQQTTNWVIASVGQLKPDDYVYATGFLASYLASLFEQDPWAVKRFKLHIDRVKEERL